jgi:RNA polymerase sigma factor (sigma-70 family)
MDDEELERTLEAALAGDRVVRNRLVHQLTPVIHKRVARALLRHTTARGRAIGQDVEGLVQNVWVHLISKDYKVLRDWKHERGLSLRNFVGLVTDRQTNLALRSRKKSPYTEDPTPIENFDRADPTPRPDEAASAKEKRRKLLEQVKEKAGPRGYYVFKLLFDRGLKPAEAAKESGLSIDAIYKWQERLRNIVRRILDE